MIKARPFQREAIDAIFAYMEAGPGNPLAVLPTGTGKSVVIALTSQEALEYPDTRILVLTHQKELILQNYMELKELWPEAPAGIYSAGLNRRDLHSRIIFAGIQSIHRHAFTLQKIDLVLVDEAHLIPRTSGTLYNRFLHELRQINPYLKVIGLTATPYRMDSGLLHRGEGRIFDDIAYEYPILDAIRQGYLTRPASKPAKQQIDTAGIKTVGGDFAQGQLEAAAIHPDVVRAVVAEIVETGRAQARRGWIVFGCGVAHCEMLAAELVRQGVNAAVVVGTTEQGRRDRLINGFKAGQVECLVSMNVLTTGFNAKHVDLVAMARPTKSVGLYIQIVGRGTRPLYAPGYDLSTVDGRLDAIAAGPKPSFTVLDFGGNIERHGPIDAPKVKGEKRKGAPREGEPTKYCQTCNAPNKIAAQRCLDCGAAFPPVVQQIAMEASSDGLLSEDQKRTATANVSRVSYRKHLKPGGKPSLRVIYTCGLMQYDEWVPLEHANMRGHKALLWWRRRAPAGMPLPETVDDALRLVDQLRTPSSIAVRKEGKFLTVTGALFE